MPFTWITESFQESAHPVTDVVCIKLQKRVFIERLWFQESSSSVTQLDTKAKLFADNPFIVRTPSVSGLDMQGESHDLCTSRALGDIAQ